ncbi:ATP-binding protein [Cylindrospermopsis curvispora]|uniref:ATP-binding protein n=1 Tax=Cylindrospermopsis curvispora GIHE-G1 TaxID=2666332 RepID=A0A7H0EYI2_9CYAN|nr:DUF499 domain-containing protein [Cylindrospermopsis curvispora]QNP28848.1 ATP-binding protein [Cylindrospermopsis curvispora GIHE-G1]
MLSTIFKTCAPREEILAGELSLDLFAAKLESVVKGTAPKVYNDPKTFFENTFATDGLKNLITEVFGRLSGTMVGSPIIRLETSFGGGKTHDEIALWHIAKHGRKIPGIERFTDNIEIIPSYAVKAGAIACQDLEPADGVFHGDTGIRTYTLWGEIAYQLGGVEGYSLLKGADELRVSPGTDVLRRIIQDAPTVIILDEIAMYLRRAKAITVGESDLAKQVVAFLFAMMDLAASTNNIVLVYTLASANDSFGEETREVREALSISARQERIIKPSTDVEIYNIVKQRMFSSICSNAARDAGREYMQVYKNSRLDLPSGCKDSSYAESIEQSYPFHPELFNLLTKKIASIPNFQRTRGALRLLAIVIRYLWQELEDLAENSAIMGENSPFWIPMIHPHHIPLGMEEEITSDLTSRLDRPLMRIPIQADIYNPDGREAHSQIQDKEWSAADKPPFTSWVTRTIFLNSINQGTAAGIRVSELNLCLLTPGMDIGFVETVLERLGEVAWYLDYDQFTSTARFKEEPSLNKVIAQEKEQVTTTETKERLRRERDTIFADHCFKLVSGPVNPSDVDDVADSIALCVIDFDEATISDTTQVAPTLVERVFENTGESGKFRIYKNRLLFLVANKQELERSLDNMREYIAIENIMRSADKLQDLSEGQRKKLKEREGNFKLNVRVSIGNTYRHLFYPESDRVKAPKGLMHYTLPAQDSGDAKKKQQEVLLKKLRDCGKIRMEDAAAYAPSYIVQKVWPAGIDHWKTKEMKEAFFKDVSLKMFLDGEISKLRETIRNGILDGSWDMKIGEKVFIKAENLKVPDSIEFSEGVELYRPGILELPKPREIEISAQVMFSKDMKKPVRVGWRASGGLKVQMYENGKIIDKEFRPRDEYSTEIGETTIFKIVVDYGNGEILEKETTAFIGRGGNEGERYGDSTRKTTVGGFSAAESGSIFAVKPLIFSYAGTVNSSFVKLSDFIKDNKPAGIQEIEISVTEPMDYRKLFTAIPLVAKLPMYINHIATISLEEQFLRLEYQGPEKGFKVFQGVLNSFLNNPQVKADLLLKLEFKFLSPIMVEGGEIRDLKKALERNPVDNLNLVAKVTY